MAFPTQSAGFVAASSQYFSAADSASLDITGNLTIEGWIKFTTLPGTDAAFSLAMKWTDTGNQHSYGLQFLDASGTKKVRFLTSNDGSAVGLATVNWTPSTGTWYHLAVVYTAASGQMELFVDGVSQGTATGTLHTSLFNSTGVFWLGQDNNSAYFNGRMVLWRVWSTTRTGTNLSDNYCTELGATANLAAEWTLDNTVNDNSGNSNTLTNNNSVTFTTDIPGTCNIDLSVSVVDSITVTEAVTMEITSFINVSDTITITESITAENTELGPISVFDSITITESVQLEQILLIDVFDSISISESVTVENTQLGNINVNDAITITESITVTVFPDQLSGIAYMRQTDDVYIYDMRGDESYSPPGMDDKAII